MFSYLNINSESGKTKIKLTDIAKACNIINYDGGKNKIRWTAIITKLNKISRANIEDDNKKEVNEVIYCIKNKINRNDLYISLWLTTMITLETKGEMPSLFYEYLNKRFNVVEFDDLYCRRKEEDFFDLLHPIVNGFGLKLIRQYIVKNKRLDGYIPEINLAIEYDEYTHKYYTYDQEEYRQESIELNIGCDFVRIDEKIPTGQALSCVINEILNRRVVA